MVADGNVALTNLTARGSAAAVTFGALDLKGAFPVRIWKDGSALSSDSVALTDLTAVEGGLIQPVRMDGCRPKAGDVFVIGSVPASVEAVPAAAKNWTVRFGAVENDRKPMLLEYTPSGVLLIVR